MTVALLGVLHDYPRDSKYRGPKDHRNIKILQTMVKLGRRTRMQDLYACVVCVAPLVAFEQPGIPCRRARGSAIPKAEVMRSLRWPGEVPNKPRGQFRNEGR